MRTEGDAVASNRGDDHELRDVVSRANRSVVEALAAGITPVIALLLVLTWLGTAMLAGFTERSFSVLFAVTGATTFVMVFLIEHATRRDLRAALLKLDVLVDALQGADEDAVGAERQTVREQEQLEADLPR